jgi:hypothetical protein
MLYCVNLKSNQPFSCKLKLERTNLLCSVEVGRVLFYITVVRNSQNIASLLYHYLLVKEFYIIYQWSLVANDADISKLFIDDYPTIFDQIRIYKTYDLRVVCVAKVFPFRRRTLNRANLSKMSLTCPYMLFYVVNYTSRWQ